MTTIEQPEQKRAYAYSAASVILRREGVSVWTIGEQAGTTGATVSRYLRYGGHDGETYDRIINAIRMMTSPAVADEVEDAVGRLAEEVS